MDGDGYVITNEMECIVLTYDARLSAVSNRRSRQFHERRFRAFTGTDAAKENRGFEFLGEDFLANMPCIRAPNNPSSLPIYRDMYF